ncbi:MAG: hypothetical protein ACF8SC_10690 [Phycisphaerales bacterium JB037]
MTPRGPRTIIDLDGSRACVIAGGQVASLQRPSKVAADDASAFGAWLAESAREAGVAIKGGVLLTLARREAVVKRFEVAVAEGAGQADLDGVIRLQMARQLAGPVEDPVVDYRILRDRTDAAGTRRLLVLAGGIPRSRLEFLSEAMGKAGCKLQGVTLRCFDTTARLIASAAGEEVAALGVTLGPGAVELVLADPSGLVAARSLEVGADSASSSEDLARQIAVEAKRIWVSYRAASDSLEVRRVVVMGGGELGDSIGRAVLESLGLGTEAEAVDSTHDSLADDGEWRGGAEALDFANPAAAPDPGARRRQLSLLGALAVILLLGGGWVLAESALGGLRADIAAASARERSLRGKVQDHLVLKGRYAHLRAWLGSRTSWMEHLEAVVADLPDPPNAIVGKIAGLNLPQSNGRDVRYVSKGDGPMEGDWIRERTVRMSVAGRTPSPEQVAAIRAAFLARGIYRVGTGRADGEPVFDFDLTSGDPRPTLPTPGEESP